MALPQERHPVIDGALGPRQSQQISDRMAMDHARRVVDLALDAARRVVIARQQRFASVVELEETALRIECRAMKIEQRPRLCQQPEAVRSTIDEPRGVDSHRGWRHCRGRTLLR